jgi:translation initiation factor IF-2
MNTKVIEGFSIKTEATKEKKIAVKKRSIIYKLVRKIKKSYEDIAELKEKNTKWL